MCELGNLAYGIPETIFASLPKMSDGIKVELPTEAALTDCRTGAEKIAFIKSLHREMAKQDIDQCWWHVEGVSKDRLQQEIDRHWEWTVLISKYQNKPYFKSVAMVLSDGSIEGAMIYRVDGKSALEQEKRTVLIDRLATAPHNREWLSKTPFYRGCGTALLNYAICQSYVLGFQGRISLFAAGRESFYEAEGFVRTGIVSDDGPHFELPSETALATLKERGMI